jgi:MATE family multidrug resistance protein
MPRFPEPEPLLLDWTRTKRILALALPIMGAMVSQSLLNLVDTAMVGVLGGDALAGVGLGGYATFMAISIVIGLGAGVQAMVARRKGQGEREHYAVPLNGGLLLGVLFAVPITLLFFFGADALMTVVARQEGVRTVAIPYFQARVLCVGAVAMNFAFRGYWNGINRSAVYMRTLVATHLLNIAISYVLIFGILGFPRMGAVGAGIGTTVALFIGSVLYFVQTGLYARKNGFLRELPDHRVLSNILSVGLPNSMQQLLFASSLMVLFFIVGLVGSAEVAVAHVLITLVLFLILPAIGLGLSATSLVGQALGRQEPEDAYRWGWEVTRLAVGLLLLLAIPMWLFPDWILGLFLHEPALVELGRAPLRITGVLVCLDGIAIVFTHALLGAGAARSVMLVTLCVQFFFFLPAAYIIGPVLGFGLLGIWLMQATQRLLTACWLGWLWVRRHWIHIEL